MISGGNSYHSTIEVVRHKCITLYRCSSGIFPIEKYILSTKGYNLFYVTLLVWVKTDVSAYGITHNKRSKMCVFQNG